MPEYLAPAVFVEETSFRAKSIEGVGTSTAAFVGMTARGPVSGCHPNLSFFIWAARSSTAACSAGDRSSSRRKCLVICSPRRGSGARRR